MDRSKGDFLLLIGASLFASWTLYCYIMVLSGRGFHDLMTYSFVPFVGGLLLARLCTEATTTRGKPSAFAAEFAAPLALPSPLFLCLLGVLAAAIAILFHLGAAYWVVWAILLCTSLLVLLMVVTGSGNGSAPLPRTQQGEKIAAAGIAIFCALLTAVTHRSDLDDSQYLNFVVTALDFPVEPLFSRSGLWADHSVPLELPLYGFHSYELLIAALSAATGVDHKVFYYLVFPPLFAGVAALVHWRLANLLSPRYALPVLLAWLVLLLALGESHRAFGNFAFIRLYQGKSLLVTVALSYCLLQGLRFSEAPARRRAVALGVAVLASLGLSSSALAAVPVVVAAVLVGGLSSASARAVRKILAGGLASSVVLVAIAAYVMSTMNLGEGNYGEGIPSAGNGLMTVLGAGVSGAVVLALFPLAPLFVHAGKRRKIYATTTVFFAACVLNPWASPFLAQTFDLALQWRLFWSVPFIVSAAVALTGVAALMQRRSSRIAFPLALPVMLVALLLLSSRWSIAPDNNVEIAFPRYKVEPQQYALAAEIVALAAPRSTVYAPTEISAWIATFRQHPYAVSFRPDYLYFGRVKKHVGNQEIERRLRVIRFLEGADTHPYTIEFFKDQLAADRPSIVVYPQHIAMANVIAACLGRNGYSGAQHGQYWLWRRQ
jgi:hypothetical protein